MPRRGTLTQLAAVVWHLAHTRAAAAPASRRARRRRTCRRLEPAAHVHHTPAICLDAATCVVLLPCRHQPLCGSPECFAMLGAPPLCPLCRERVA
jgi:hypothetical protein